VADEGLVRVGRRESVLERRAASDELERTAAGLDVAVARANETLGRAEQARRTAGIAVHRAREELDAARRARRIAEEQERAVARSSEAAAREAAWQVAQLERARAAADRAQADVAALGESAEAPVDGDGDGATAASSGAQTEIAALERRVRALQSVRDARAAEVGASHARRSEAEEQRRRAEIGLGLDMVRLEELDREMARLVGADADLAVLRDRLAAGLAAAAAEQAAAETTLSAVLASGTDERARLLSTEATAAEARERLRAAELRSRAAEVAEMEVRLQFDAAREGLLVELAGIGPDGLAALRADAGTESAAANEGAPALVDEDLTPALEAALDAALAAWRASAHVTAAAAPASGAEVPLTAGRLGSLRRRYHELGVSNPFAAQEYAEVRARLETLDAQRADLEAAIHSTRELIGTLNGLITKQFRQTFSALEGAFARRFRQLFDGGEAELSLTAPEDLSTTGVEITARPPGKKRQPLAMLSGGERALTAVALLLAMLEVRPVPFCVLDEVDAALDEANIGRFSSALRGLAESIQFIVITHNRGTIEAADALYGVTVGDDAVSRVVSLRLADRVVDSVAVPVTDGQPVATQVVE
jgi:chromosome segregation protein